jgi:site-specific recombinase XerC
MLFDWLVTGQVVPFNPAASVRGPRYSIRKGKTPLLSAQETRKLLDKIDTSHVDGLRDRALIGTMVYSFARVSAVVNMKVRDYYPQGKCYWLRLHEKGGKFHEVPAHHTVEQYILAIDTRPSPGISCGSPWGFTPVVCSLVSHNQQLGTVRL